MQTVIGLFDNAHEAQKAAQELLSEGFTSNNVDVSVKNTGGGSISNSYGDTEKSSGSYQDDLSTGNLNLGSDTNYGSGATGYNSGADHSTGSTLTSDKDTYGSSSGYDRTDDDKDGFGDKVSRFFKNLFGDDDDKAERYATVANTTGCVVTVHAQSKAEAEKAADILDDNGAIDVDKNSSEYGYSGYSSAANSGESDTLNVIREDVEIGKSQVETGGVRLRSRIVERPVEEELRLREERVYVERKSVDRPATTSDLENFKEGEIEMTEYAEVPDVRKQARVVEEVSISKEVNERKETINETAHDTEVEVENLSKSDVSGRSNRT